MPFEVVPNHSVDEASVTNHNYLETQEQKTVDNVAMNELQVKQERSIPRISKPK